MALTAAQGLYTTDLRYSEAAVGLSQALDYSHAPLVWPALASALSVFVLALALCLLFLGQARRQDQPKQGKLKVRTPRGGTSTAGRGVLRFCRPEHPPGAACAPAWCLRRCPGALPCCWGCWAPPPRTGSGSWPASVTTPGSPPRPPAPTAGTSPD